MRLFLAALLLLGPEDPRITGIRAAADAIEISVAGATGDVAIVELRPWESEAAGRAPVYKGPVKDGRVTLPRLHDGVDRIYSQFSIGGEPRFVDELIADRNFDFPKPTSIKGLSCIVDDDDAIALGTQWANVNVYIPSIIDRSGKSTETVMVDGERFAIDTAYVTRFDGQIKRLTDAGISITVVLNNPIPKTPDPANPFIHPRSDLAGAPNHLGAFNVDDERGFRAYRAALEYLGARYSAPGAPHGWIGGYIVGNEVQSHREWYNLGKVSPEDFVRHYARALRMTWLAVRRSHARARVYVSMDHHWAKPFILRGDDFLEKLNGEVHRGGDFPWHVAFHPYPENLFNPKVWNDRVPAALDAPKITFKNLEVLPAFLAQERFLYKGEPRRIILSEQGFHRPKGDDGDTVQAAAYAYAYVRASRLPTIDAFMLHRHVDHRGEGGLLLGLWTADPNSPNPSKPLQKRKIWEAYREAGGKDQDAAFAFALPVIGIASWADLYPRPVR